jgi:sugar lactone lactonase YvrE
MTGIPFIKKTYQLGEGPIWDHRIHRLYYIDIDGMLLAFIDQDSDQPTEIALPKMPGTVILSNNPDEVYLLLEDGLYKYVVYADNLEFISRPKENLTNYRFNEGKCDPFGHIIVGTMHKTDAEKKPGILYRIDPLGDFMIIDQPIHIPNGMVWDLEHGYYYIIDSPKQLVYRYDLDLTTGAINNKIPWINFAGENSFPDGMTSDESGMLYIANWKGHRISKWNPLTKEKLDEYEIDALNVTSCVFGGDKLDRLFVSSASVDTPKSSVFSHCGNIFYIDHVANGLPSNLYTFKK